MNFKQLLIRSIRFLLFTLILFSCIESSAIGDGKFLRGEKWQRFSIQDSKADFYVAPDGNDYWSGTLAVPNKSKNDGPFATIERAQQAVRLLKNQVYTPKNKVEDTRFIGSSYEYGAGKDILVLIRGGKYFLKQPLYFDSEDGGERCETDLPSGAFEFHKLKDYFVTYAAYPGETPVISGARKITSWKKQNPKWVTKVRDMEINKLIANGKQQTLARAPNDGYFIPAEMPLTTTEFKFRPGDLKKWSDIGNNKIHFVLRWHKGVNSIDRIDEKNQIVYLHNPQKGLVVVPPRYYVENIEALLDAPGEWYFDKQTKNLSYIPGENIDDPNEADITAPALSQLMVVQGKSDRPVRNLRFYGLTFEATHSGQHAISFEYAKNCELVDTDVRHVGGIAVYLTNGCYQNKILNNKILNAEKGGIAVKGNPHPDQWMDVVRENIVSYNYVSDCGGISIGAHNALFTTISHNEITNTRGRYAMNVGGWRNIEEALEGGYRIEYNHLHHVQNGADDSGAITCSGLTQHSIIRRNLIHDVFPGYFNDNVAFWFDNMSAGWTVEENIYYNLKQGEMKLCACYLEDNIYRDNFLIKAPQNEPEPIIDGFPKLEYRDLQVTGSHGSSKNDFKTGELLKISAAAKNVGATGIDLVDLYVDGKIVASKKFPVVHHNEREVSFDYRFHEPGEHRVAIATTPYETVNISGESLVFLYSGLQLSKSIVPVSEQVMATANIENVKNIKNRTEVNLYVDGTLVDSKPIELSPKQSTKINFVFKPTPGIHKVGIDNNPPLTLEVYPHHSVDIRAHELRTYCSGTATPCEFDIRDQYKIIVHGTDFYHAEDSYGTIYLKDAIQGNFIATVKVTQFGENVTEWFRTGIFVRNDITKSYETEPGSLGSVLMFSSPKRFGMQWDEYGDGCMHKASSQNHDKKISQIWLKLERHGNSFTGSISHDGKNWTNPTTTTDVPGLADTMDIGLAAGANNQSPSLVVFEDFRLEVEDVGWK